MSNAKHLALALSICVIAATLSGCAGTPARCLNEPTIFDAPRSSQEPINFIRLRQDPPDVYVLGRRDILGIFIEGVLGNPDEAPPIHYPEEASDLPPAVGYPIPIREDGTISLPLVNPIPVEGLSLPQAEQLIKKAFTENKQIIPKDNRILVTLMKPRTYNVLVIREDRSNAGAVIQGDYIIANSKRGSAYSLELPAYKNDVLQALSESGGLPGLDAKNQVTILRGGFEDAGMMNQYLHSYLSGDASVEDLAEKAAAGELKKAAASVEPIESTANTIRPEIETGQSEFEFILNRLEQANNTPSEFHTVQASSETPVGVSGRLDLEARNAQTVRLASQPHLDAGMLPGMSVGPVMPGPEIIGEVLTPNPNVVKIPLRMGPGVPYTELSEDDIILGNGDIVFIESRDAEVFYTSGLIPGGQYEIPRDYDLDVLGAIAMAGGSTGTALASSSGSSFFGGGGGGSSLGGIIPATRISVTRIRDGHQMNIVMNLKRLKSKAPHERFLVQPNDVISLEYTPCELIANIALGMFQINYFLNRN